MAILKHIASKNKIYSAAEQYLCFEHDGRTGKPVLDNEGRMIPRAGIITAAINCDFGTFAAESMETNHYYHKNRSRADIKSHDYILSFDPRDSITGEEAMEIAKKFAGKFLEGHQTIIVVHPDGHNGSGNIHAHIVANSVRKYPAVKQKWHEKACEYKQGCKHKCTNAMLRAGKQWVMDECHRRNLNQVDLFSSKVREDYWVKKRGLEKDSEFMSEKDKLREAIDAILPHSDSIEDFIDSLDNLFGITTRVTNKTISFKSENSKQATRGNRLGDDYTKDALMAKIEKYRIERMELKEKNKHEAEKLAEKIIADAKMKKQEQQKKALEELSDLMRGVNQALDRLAQKEEETLDRFDSVLNKSITSTGAMPPHYDSYITEDYPIAAIEAEIDAETELQEIRKPKEWKEELSDYMKDHLGMDVDEVIYGFDAYYDKLWDDYYKSSRQEIDRDIRVKGR